MSPQKKSSTKKAKLTHFKFAITGREPEDRKVASGTTYLDVIEYFSLQGVTVLVNGSKSFRMDGQVQEGDTITAVTAVKAG